MASVSQTIHILPGDCIAQLLLLPYVSFPKIDQPRQGGFGSIGKKIFWETLINDQRPTSMLKIQDIEFLGLIDTGADVSIISLRTWPNIWEKQRAQITLSGLGSSREVFQSSSPMTCIGPEGQTAVVSFYIVDISINLWG